MGRRIKVIGFCIKSPQEIEDLYLKQDLEYLHWFLRGDYTIIIEEDEKTIYITDFAGTQSCNQILSIPRNHTIVVENNKIVFSKENISMSMLYYSPPQGIKVTDKLDTFFDAIDDAVKIRCTDNPVIALSSGHDSGTIVASALAQNLQFSTMSVLGVEDQPVIYERVKKIKNHKLIKNWNHNRISGHDVLSNNMKQENKKILISGLGTDEYLNSKDYQLFNYFKKKEMDYYISNDISLRYPLLDPRVYFTYHSIKPSLRHNKKPLIEYMKNKGFPYSHKEKFSFDLK